MTHLILWLLLLSSGQSWAHRLNLFAGGVGDLIEGQVYYAGQIPAPDATITLHAEQPITLQPQADGRFSSRVVERRDYRLVAVTPDGHRAQWTVPASELSPSLPVAKEASQPVDSKTPAQLPGAAAGTSGLSTQQLETLLARQIQPLREQLDRYERKIRLHDLLGGIGFIFGLAGVALWWKSRQRVDGKSPQRDGIKSPQRDGIKRPQRDVINSPQRDGINNPQRGGINSPRHGSTNNHQHGDTGSLEPSDISSSQPSDVKNT